MGNEDLFGEWEEPIPESKEEEKIDEDWGEEPDPMLVNEGENIDEELEERLDSSEVTRNAKIAYVEEAYQKLNEFFQSDKIKPYRWSIQKVNQFYFKIKRRSEIIGFVKTKIVFNFYNRKLENAIKAEESLEGLFDFR